MQLFTNNASSKLAVSISNVSLTLSVKPGDGAKFPSPTGGNFFLVTLSKVNSGIETSVEIVKCTARTGDALTIVRAQEGTTALVYAEDDRVELRMTAASAIANEAHLNNTSNPHSTTKTQVGLGSVDNTADVDKPISTATATALALKAPLASPTFTGTVSGITKAMVGLGNVDNTSDVNKPVSTATSAAITASFAAPPAIGSTTPSTGAFTTLSATGNISFGATGAVGVVKLARHTDGAFVSEVRLSGTGAAPALELYNGVASATNIYSAGSVVGAFTSTGLAVNGALSATTTGADNVVGSYSSSGGDAKFYLECSGTNSGYMKYKRSAQSLVWSANNTNEHLTLDSAGNLGLGVTPSAWGAGYNVFEMGAACGVTVLIANDFVSAHNAYYNGANWIYKQGAYATRYAQSRATGQHKWSIAPSGTAASAITFTDVLAVEKDKTLALQGATSQTGAGISFPATQVASSDANTLDDYEEGTFTPTIVGTTTAGAGTYAYQKGRYQKIGNKVSFDVSLSWSAHTGTGNIRISGLPFSSNSTTSLYSMLAAGSVALVVGTGKQLQAYVDVGAATASLEAADLAGGAVSAVAMDTSATVIVSGTYFV